MTAATRFQLEDDGTLDTVLGCSDCGAELRYTFDGQHVDDCVDESGKCDCYEQFVARAIQDADDAHECGECSGPATCVDHSEAYAEAHEETTNR